MVEKLTPARRREMTRAALLDAAETVFARRGFEGASLDEIAEAAGFTRGAIYKNFDGKEDLFFALFDREIDAERRRVPHRVQCGSGLRPAQPRDHREHLAAGRARHRVVHAVPGVPALRGPTPRDAAAVHRTPPARDREDGRPHRHLRGENDVRPSIPAAQDGGDHGRRDRRLLQGDVPRSRRRRPLRRVPRARLAACSSSDAPSD